MPVKVAISKPRYENLLLAERACELLVEAFKGRAQCGAATADWETIDKACAVAVVALGLPADYLDAHSDD